MAADTPPSLSAFAPAPPRGPQALQAQSQKLPLISAEPGLSSAACPSGLDRTPAARTAAIDWDTPRYDWSAGVFAQLIDRLALPAGRVSLNFISVFICGQRLCAEMKCASEGLWVWGEDALTGYCWTAEEKNRRQYYKSLIFTSWECHMNSRNILH